MNDRIALSCNEGPNGSYTVVHSQNVGVARFKHYLNVVRRAEQFEYSLFRQGPNGLTCVFSTAALGKRLHSATDVIALLNGEDNDGVSPIMLPDHNAEVLAEVQRRAIDVVLNGDRVVRARLSV